MKTIRIDGVIGSEARADEIVSDIRTADGPVHLQLATEGGSVMQGQRILAEMRRHPHQITAEVEYAFSMGAMLALEADKLSMPGDGWLMFHQVSSAARGPAAAHDRAADIARRMDAMTAEKLAARTGQPAADVLQKLPDEIWLTGTEAHALGIVDELLQPRRLAAKFDGENYEALPAQLCLDCAAAADTRQGMSELLEGIKARFAKGKEEEAPETPTTPDFTQQFHELELQVQEQRDCIAFLRDQLAETQEEVAEARKSAGKEANRILAQAGHDPVGLSEHVAEAKTLEERYAELKTPAERIAFRQEHAGWFKAQTGEAPKSRITGIISRNH